MKTQKIVLALMTSLAMVGAAHADFKSGQSYGGEEGDGLLSLGTYNGTAAGGVDGVSIFGQSHASFLQHFTRLGADSNGVYNVAGSDIPGHGNIGVWNFKQVGSADVWFGNWATEVGTTKAADPSTYTVFYNGQAVDSAISSANYGVTANYSVSGLNNGNYYSGTYVATFGASATGTGTLTGTLTDGTSTFNVGTATINNATAAISGSNASWTGGKTASGGVVSGNFFNTQAQLAGIATFTDRSYDIAFGGVRQ
ncbi:hypothetical protein F4V57_14560 [Acinetobacter qingfengensis]|uniref:Transferrin-binding protein B C-lobe/N-lobe beta barrel domain-containing protein n=1 Tax=Acinetobacter qingfengensis TaxID=1262585 RepID=A0A1E7QZR0_9GAMM|nr:Slam-dependent surface lipoprotein [Acinetobacter qingfengensis]KAA8730824.1 hypothetical protein F4V57_14560 [Acinetobacter qingfengensis]OEY92531.1 hypothetical protein BJI46_14595 [Acinetobacter qingfengensis]